MITGFSKDSYTLRVTEVYANVSRSSLILN